MSFSLVLQVLLPVCTWAQQTAAPAAPPKPAPAKQRMNGTAQRNENVAIYQIDTNAVKESNIRVGDTVTIVSEAPVEQNHFAVEHGAAPSETIAARPTLFSQWHAELYGWHQNSIFNARTFFQVGGVLPSHRNFYGGRFTGPVGALGSLTATFSQRKVRAVVNGNVLVPLASERTPLATDPRVRAMVSRFLAAYPAELPNRLDFDPRALNTNSPQKGDDIDASVRLDRDFAGGKLMASHTLSRQTLDAFQLVAGQNPDTQIHAHRSRIAWRRTLSASTELAAGFQFNRTKSLLLPEPNAVGPRVRMGTYIEELGPDSMFPINRAQNSFRYGAVASTQASGGAHALTYGADLMRTQVNGVETNNERGYFQFTNNFGHTAVENLLLGTPSMWEATIGPLDRGFRNWTGNAFFADRWKVSPSLQIYWGLRYNLVTAPVEVNGLTEIPYGCDCNNFSPRFAIAWRGPVAWVMRASYTVSFGEIMPVTYQQARNNLPLVRYIQVQTPDLLDPLKNADLNRTSPTILSPDMVSPYVHQYNYTLEHKLGGATMRLGYLGSRAFKLQNIYVQNRAEPVPGIPLTTATIDLRRPDQRYYEVKRVLNGGIAYADAAQARFDLPQRKGLAINATYTFGKAIDEGSDYAYTAANKDMTSGRSQFSYGVRNDKKSLSLFDSTHALLVNYSYELPRATASHGWLAWIANGWQISGVTLMKSGTPLTLYIGSDGPGYGNVDGSPSERPNILDPSILGKTISNPDVATSILRRDRFSYLVPGQTAGSLGRDTFRKAGIANWNFALNKMWRWDGRREGAVLLRVEAYNLTNHAQFDEPQRNYSTPAFGKITNSLNDGRVFQIGLRVII